MTTPVDPAAPVPTHDPDTVALLVIGGGPAGLAAATAYREAGGAGRVVLISADDMPPYNRPPLSKDYLRGESGEDDLPLQPATDYDGQHIELRLADPVISLDTGARRVRTAAGSEIGYRSVVLATGCAPSLPPVDGGDHPSVARLRTLSDGRFLRTAAESAKRAVVIGSGFIGCEAAASLAARGVAVTMVTSEELPQLARLGRPVAERIAGWLTGAGVRVLTSEPVLGIDADGAVRTESGSHEADLVLAAVGVSPNSGLAEQAGLAVTDGRVLVDASMSTGVPGVYAAGDVVFAENATAGRRLKVEHWGEAERMGQIAGRAAAGVPDSWGDVPGFWSEIGDHPLQYAAWGDGFDALDLVDHGDGAFTVWYSTAGRTVGVLTHHADEDYERGFDLIAEGAPPPSA